MVEELTAWKSSELFFFCLREDVQRPINFFTIPPWPKINIYSDAIWKNWDLLCQNGVNVSPCKLWCFSDPEWSDFESSLSLFNIFNLCHSCSQLLSFFLFVPGFIEVDRGTQIIWHTICKFLFSIILYTFNIQCKRNSLYNTLPIFRTCTQFSRHVWFYIYP